MLRQALARFELLARQPAMRVAAAAVVTAIVLAIVVSAWLGGREPTGGMSAPEIAAELKTWTLEPPGGATSVAVTLPGHLEERLPARESDYVLVTRAVLPPAMRGKPLTLAITSLPAMATARIDGVEATSLDPRPFDRYHATSPLRWRVPDTATEDGVLDVQLIVHHRWLQSAWFETAPFVTTALDGGERLIAIATFNRAAATAALGAASFVVLVYGVLAALVKGSRRKVYALFALSALAGLFYPAMMLGLTQPVFGIFESEIVGSMLIISAVTAIYFSHAYFHLPPPHIAWKGWISFAAVAAALANDPFRAITLLGPLIGVSVAANSVVQTLLFVKLRRVRPRPNNLYFIVLAWPATGFLAPTDGLAWLGAGSMVGGVRSACLGLAAIWLLQTIALLREHVTSIERADRLNAELNRRIVAVESKQREVEMLNDELRRQIAARTAHLASSMAREDSGPVVQREIALGPGAVIDDRYEVVRRIGEGGMGAVYEVERIVDKRHFALKTLIGVSDPYARARFAREAQIAANVKHPNVVGLIDFDVAKAGYLFLVMEFIAGNTLHEVRRRQRDIPWTLYVLAQLAEGLDAIHEQGIVHRDLKPTNVLLSRGADGRRPLVKITDFGVSSLLSESPPSVRSLLAGAANQLPPITGPTSVDGGGSPLGGAPIANVPVEELTVTGALFGTPNYMAAELTAGTKSATRAADIFAVGVIAFELLTFRRPFAENPVSVILAGRPPPPPRFDVVCPSLPRRLAELLNRSLAHEPAQRPTAKELATALRDAFAQTSALDTAAARG